MKTTENILITVAAMLAAASLVAAVLSGAWWHFLTGAMFATLSTTMYNESKSEQA